MPDSKVNLAIQLCEAGQWEDGLREFQLAADSTSAGPEKATILLSQVDCLTKLGRLTQARERFEQARNMMPKTDQARQELAYGEVDLLIAEGQLARALGNIQELRGDYVQYSAQPDYRALWEAIEIRRGLVLSALRRPKEALPILEAAQGFEEVERPGSFFYSLAQCHYDVGNYDSAKQAVLEGFQRGYDGQTMLQARFLLGQLHYQQKAYARALQEFEACESRLEELGVPRKVFYLWMEQSCAGLNLHDRVEKYKQMGRG